MEEERNKVMDEKEESNNDEIDESNNDEKEESNNDEKDESNNDEESEGVPAGAILENGEINWDCPCMGGFQHGPCGQSFRDSFTCFIESKADPKGSDCYEHMRDWSQCMKDNAEYYNKLKESSSDKDDDGKDKEDDGKYKEDDKGNDGSDNGTDNDDKSR